MQNSGRIVFLDYLRIIACFMVMLIHACEPFYLDAEGTFIASRHNALLVTLIDSALRAAVPLFVMTSSYLLFPLKTSPAEFFKKRFARVFIPFVVWLLMYSLVPQYGADADPVGNLKQLIFNFPGPGGILWFVYMLIGVYLTIWLLSGWISNASKKEEQVFLGIWLFTTLFPFFRQIVPGGELWGEANWNEFGAFYYVSGFVGFVVLGHYFRTYLKEMSWKKTLAIAVPHFLAGYAISASWFWCKIPKEFPVRDDISLAVLMEQSWRFCSIGVVLVTIAYFLIIRKFNYSGKAYSRIVLPLSRLSYGMYLMHIFFLTFWNAMLVRWGVPALGNICLTAVLSFVTSAIAARLISLLPSGKYVVG